MHQLSDGSLKPTNHLGQQDLPGGEVSKRAKLPRLDELTLDASELDLEGGGVPDESREGLGHGHRVLAQHQPGRAFEVRPEAVQRRFLEREPGQAVLHHLVLRRYRFELLSEVRELLDRQAAILGEDRGFYARQLGFQGLDRLDFHLRGHCPVLFLEQVGHALGVHTNPRPHRG